MKKVTYAIVAIVAISIFALLYYLNNNESNSHINQNLLMADSLMFIKPDSSLLILNEIKGAEKFDAGNRALYALLLTQARSRNYIKASNDSLINIALSYYSTSQDSIRKAWTYVYASDVYEELEDRKLSLNYIQKAACAANGSGDDRLLCFIYYLWGWMLHNDKPYDAAITKYKESEKYARNLKDTSLIVIRLRDIGRNYMYKEDYDSATVYFSQAIGLSQKANLCSNLTSLYKKQALTLYMQKRYQESSRYLAKAKIYVQTKNDSLQFYALKGDVMLKLNQIDSARYYIERGKSDKNFYTQANYQDLMALLESKRGNYKKALEYRTTYANLLDSISKEEAENRVIDLQKRYDYTQVKIENDQLKINNQQTKIALLLFVILVISVVSVMYFVISRKRRKDKSKVYAARSMVAQSLNQVQKKNADLVLAKQEFREKEMMLSSDLLHKDDELLMLRQNLQELKDMILMNSEVVQKIESLKNMSDKKKIFSKSLILSEQELELLIAVINSCFNGFANRLKSTFKDLTDDDICICCLLKIGATNQDITILFNISDATLRKRKYRLKNEKINTEEDYKTLDDFINAF